MIKTGFVRKALLLGFWAVFGVLAAVLLNGFVIISARVVTGSMEGTIMAEDRVIGLRTSYIFNTPQRGDIIVFASPLPDEFSDAFIKRVVALPGEEISIISGVVHINGMPLIESYAVTSRHQNFAKTIVPAGHVFVMGDNRDFSRDSREWGSICTTSIIGRIIIY